MSIFVGSRIKALRANKNYTVEKMADEIGIDRRTYTRIESGVIDAPPGILEKIEHILGETILKR